MPFEPSIAGLQFPPPYACHSLKAFTFPMLAETSKLQAVCDQFLNLAPPGTHSFEPISVGKNGPSLIMLQAIDYASLNARTPPWDEFTGAPQNEVALAVPVVHLYDGRVIEVGVFVPFIYVDYQVSALTGREVLGLPKILAQFSLVRDFPHKAIEVRLETRATKGSAIKQLQFLKVTGDPGDPWSLSDVDALIEDPFFGPLDRLFKDSEHYGMMKAAQASRQVCGFASRTLIDPGNRARDSYRSIIRCRYTISNTTQQKFLNRVRIRFTPLLGIDIEETLGIRRGSDGYVVPIFPFQMHYDLGLDAETLWETCGR